MTPQERLERVTGIIRRAREIGDAEALDRAARLLARLVTLDYGGAQPEPAAAGTGPHVARTRAREDPQPGRPDSPARGTVPGASHREVSPGDERAAAGLHRLRKGRDACGATRRDGEPCRAPAIPGGTVCRRHGGAAPQVVIAAGHLHRQLAAWSASRAFDEARGTPREFDALCRWSAADRSLGEYEAKLALLSELRAGLRERRATCADSSQPALAPRPIEPSPSRIGA